MNTTWAEVAHYPRIGRDNISTRLATQLRRQISSGELQPGQRLPSNRRLAEVCGVSLVTVRSAMAHLDALGLIQAEHGIGTFVTRTAADERRLLSVELRRASPLEITQLRMTIEREAASRAARRVPGSSYHRLVTGPMLYLLAGERSRGRFEWPERLANAEIELHTAIVAAAGPRGAFATRLHARLMRRLTPWLVQASVDLAEEPFDELHYQLVGAILDGEAEQAERLAVEIGERETGATREALR